MNNVDGTTPHIPLLLTSGRASFRRGRMPYNIETILVDVVTEARDVAVPVAVKLMTENETLFVRQPLQTTTKTLLELVNKVL